MDGQPVKCFTLHSNSVRHKPTPDLLIKCWASTGNEKTTRLYSIAELLYFFDIGELFLNWGSLRGNWTVRKTRQRKSHPVAPIWLLHMCAFIISVRSGHALSCGYRQERFRQELKVPLTGFQILNSWHGKKKKTLTVDVMWEALPSCF